MQARTGISERRACQLIGLSRSVLRYQPRASVQNELQAQLVELAQERRRFGYRRLHILLRRAGVQVNHKRIYRLYRAAGLMVKRRRRRHGIAVERERLSLPSAPNQVWSMDFVFDALSTGRRIKCLTVVDDFTKESVGILVEHGISSFTSPGLWTKWHTFGATRRRSAPTKVPSSPARRSINGPISATSS